MSTAERPLRADAARNRTRLVQAARELFAERGLTVSMDDIAKHAGVGVGTAYRRFACREDLIDALFEDRIEQLFGNVERALEDPDPWRGLATFLERHVAMQADDRGLKELLFSPAELRERVAPVRARLMPLVERLFERAKAAGELRADVTPMDLPALTQMLVATAELAPDLWRRYLALVLDGLRARRDGATALPRPPLRLDELDAAMRRCR